MEVRGGRKSKKSKEKAPIFGFRASKIGNDSMVNCMVDAENETMQLMVEDLCQWLSEIVGQDAQVAPDNFFKQLEDGVILCRLANAIQEYAVEAAKAGTSELLGRKINFKSSSLCERDKSRFHARENVSKFLDWCRSHKVPSPMLFESNDIVVGGRDGGREVIICLMNLAKRFSIDYYVPAPETLKVEVANEIEIRKKTAELADANNTATTTTTAIPTLSATIDTTQTGACSPEQTPSVPCYTRVDEEQLLDSRQSVTESTHNHNIATETTYQDQESQKNLGGYNPFRDSDTEQGTDKENRNSLSTETLTNETQNDDDTAEAHLEKLNQNQSNVSMDTEENQLHSIDLIHSIIEESLNESSMGVSSVNDEIIDNVADTVMFADDGSGDTLDEMEQVLLEEDNLFRDHNISPHYNFESVVEKEKIDPDTPTNRAKTSDVSTAVSPGDQLKNQKANENDVDDSKPRAKSLTSMADDWVVTNKTAEPNPISGIIKLMTDAQQSDNLPPQPAACKSCRAVDTTLVCGNCAKLLQRDPGHNEDFRFVDESDFISPELNDSRLTTTVDDDLETLRNLCHILIESGCKNRHPVLKFVCIQLGQKYIFIKKVKGRIYVRYNRKWVLLHGLIQDIKDCKVNSGNCAQQSQQNQH